MAVNRHGRIERLEDFAQFRIAGVGTRSSPEIVWAGVNQSQRAAALYERERLQPLDPALPKPSASFRNHFLDCREKGLQFRGFGGELVKFVLRPQHLIGIAANARPSEFANSINYLGRARATVGQVSTMQDQVRGSEFQVSKNGFERREVAVNVRYNRDSHTGGDEKAVYTSDES